ncbi:RNA polymerase II transcription elongation factor-domain-containing protein [Mucidula mucida]|nr:RNA polymerase II transcription elongation factor-domain-containing protein [Mucidula mucida]
MAATSSSAGQWVPEGKHNVQIGSSMTRMMQIRRNEVPNKKFPPREFYSMRYNFKPSSVNANDNGKITFKQPQGDKTTVVAEHPSTQPGEVHVFNGSASAAKDMLCVLVYDQTTGIYTLEKMDTVVTLEYTEKKQMAMSPPAATAHSPPVNGKGKAKSFDEDFEEILPENLLSPRDEEEGQVVSPPPPPPIRDPSPLPKPKKAALKPKAPPKPKPEPKAKAEPKPKAEPKLKAAEIKAKPNLKRPSNVDVEEFDMGRPPVKKAKPAPPRPSLVAKPPPPPPREPAKLELPGSSSSYAQPLPLPAPMAPAIQESDDEEEDEWDEVEAPGSGGPQEDDEEDFLSKMLEEAPEEELQQEQEQEQEQEQDEEEDFLLEGLQEEPASESLVPMSLNQFEGGAGEFDDYSSSGSDSDDD